MSGVGRSGITAWGVDEDGSLYVGGRERMCSYMSRTRSKSVGKKISKKPCLTRNVEQGTMFPRKRVWTTGALMPGTESGREEKSDRRRRWRGKYLWRIWKREMSRVGMNSGVVRLGANGALESRERKAGERAKSGFTDGSGWESAERRLRKLVMRGSMTGVYTRENSPDEEISTMPWYGSSVRVS